MDVEQMIKAFLDQYPNEEWGNAHVILSDYNLADDYLQSALNGEYGAISDVCRAFLLELLEVPENVREAVLEGDND